MSSRTADAREELEGERHRPARDRRRRRRTLVTVRSITTATRRGHARSRVRRREHELEAAFRNGRGRELERLLARLVLLREERRDVVPSDRAKRRGDGRRRGQRVGDLRRVADRPRGRREGLDRQRDRRRADRSRRGANGRRRPRSSTCRSARAAVDASQVQSITSLVPVPVATTAPVRVCDGDRPGQRLGEPRPEADRPAELSLHERRVELRQARRCRLSGERAEQRVERRARARREARCPCDPRPRAGRPACRPGSARCRRTSTSASTSGSTCATSSRQASRFASAVFAAAVGAAV